MPSRRRSKRCRTPNVPPPFTSFAPDGIRGAGALAVVLTYSLPRAGGGTADAHGSGPCVRKDVRVQIPPRPRVGLAYSLALASFAYARSAGPGGRPPGTPRVAPSPAAVPADGLVLWLVGGALLATFLSSLFLVLLCASFFFSS